MKKNLFLTFAAGLSLTLLQACSPGGSLIESKREASFYNQFVNPTAEWAQAESRLAELKVLETDQTYSMRFALFENGKAYYQIHNLGNGNGTWAYQDGALVITATRPIFDMELTLSAANVEGNETVARFVDRYGLNSSEMKFRDPEALKTKGVTPKGLKVFKISEKNI